MVTSRFAWNKLKCLLKPLCVFPVACVFAVQELQCGERAEGPGGGEEDVLSWQSNHLSDQDREHPVDGHRGTWLVRFEHTHKINNRSWNMWLSVNPATGKIKGLILMDWLTVDNSHCLRGCLIFFFFTLRS